MDGRRTDGRRTTEPAYTISSPGAFGSGELKIRNMNSKTQAVLEWEKKEYDLSHNKQNESMVKSHTVADAKHLIPPRSDAAKRLQWNRIFLLIYLSC